jgi:hypothetical protein
MASWEQLKQFVHSNYVVSQDLESALKLEFRGDNGRTQLVFIGYEALMNGSEGWVTIESPIGKISEIDLKAAVVSAGEVVCGGVGAWSADTDLLMLRHALPLENMDVNEFERPMQLVTGTADRIENSLTGEDRF